MFAVATLGHCRFLADTSKSERGAASQYIDFIVLTPTKTHQKSNLRICGLLLYTGAELELGAAVWMKRVRFCFLEALGWAEAEALGRVQPIVHTCGRPLGAEVVRQLSLHKSECLWGNTTIRRARARVVRA